MVWGMGHVRVMLWPWDPACGDRGLFLLLFLSLLFHFLLFLEAGGIIFVLNGLYCYCCSSQTSSGSWWSEELFWDVGGTDSLLAQRAESFLQICWDFMWVLCPVGLHFPAKLLSVQGNFSVPE